MSKREAMQPNSQNDVLLFIARHAEAKPKGFSVGRPLSDRGIVEAKLLGENLKKDGFQIETILHSGVMRSEQTAEIVQNEISAKNFMLNQKLSQGFSENAGYWLTFIECLQKTTLIIGHNPTILEILQTANPSLAFEFTTGSCICIKKNPQNLTFTEIWSYKIPKG